MNNLLGMIWQVSVGLLALLGMLGIFVFLSAQRKLDKARDVYWELVAPPENTFQQAALGRKGLRDYVDFLRSRYNLYELVTSDANKGSALLTMMLSLSNKLILIVTLIWGIGLIVLCTQIESYAEGYIAIFVYIICGCALVWLCDILEKIERVADSEGIYPIKDLLDVSKTETKVNTEKFMIETLAAHINLEVVPKLIKVGMEFGLPFHGFTFDTIITVYDKNGRKIKAFRRNKVFEYQPTHAISEPYSYQLGVEVPEDIYNDITTVHVRIIYNQFEFSTPMLERNEIQGTWANPTLISIEHMSQQQLIRLFDCE